MKTLFDYANHPPEEVYALLLRFGLAGAAFLGLAGATQLWTGGHMTLHLTSVMLAFGNYIMAFSLLILATRRDHHPRSVWLLVPALALVVGSRCYVFFVQQSLQGTHAATTDVLMLGDYASRILLQGRNPYNHDLIDAFRVLRRSTVFNTPLLDGDFTAQVAYPALAVLIFVPFQVLHLPVSLVYPIFLGATFIVIFWRSPKLLRPIVLLPFFLDPEYINYALGGVNDIVWAFFLCAMIASWDRKIWRAVLFGLACAFKQTPWLLAPFLLIRLWNGSEEPPRNRLKMLGVFVGISVTTFLVFNLPFMVLDFKSWFAGVMEPFGGADMIFYGQGLSILTMLGYVAIPKRIYSFLVLMTYCVALFLYWRHGDRYPEAMWIVPGIALWFGHRSLTSYWYYFVFPLWLDIMRGSSPPPSPAVQTASPRPDRTLSLAVLGSLPVATVALVLFYAVQKPAITLEALPPYYAEGEQVNRLQVRVSNNSQQTLTPRFSVHSQAVQPFFWHIDSGPIQLAPQETGTYWISTDVPFEAFNLKQGGRVLATDALSYDRRGVTVIQPDVAARFIDGIPNGSYQFWDKITRTVTYWGRTGTTPQPDAYALVADAELGTEALQMTLARSMGTEDWSTVMLDTWLIFPETPVSIWVNPPAEVNHLDDLTTVYGLELLSTYTRNRIWVLFGDQRSSGQLDETHYYYMVPAPRDTWSLQMLDLAQVYADLGIEMAAPRPITRYGLDFPKSMLNFRLLLAAQPEVGLPITARYGPVSVEEYRPAAAPLVQTGLDQPEQALLWRGEFNFDARNFEKAHAYYLDALAVSPSNERALYGLAETAFWLGRYEEAAAVFQQSHGLAYRPAESMRGLGWSRLALGDLGGAADAFTAAVVADPGLADAYHGLGTVWAQRGECSQATVYFSKAVALDPWLEEPRRGMERCYQP